jgi:hypothetical protein
MASKIAISLTAPLLLLGVAQIARADQDGNALLNRLVKRYHDAKTYQARGVVVAWKSPDTPTVFRFQTFEIAFQRNKALKAVEHEKQRDGSEQDVVAWGPIDPLRTYKEVRHRGFVNYTTDEDGSVKWVPPFGQFYVGREDTSALAALCDLLVDGKLPTLADLTDALTADTSGKDPVLIQRRDDAARYGTFERRYTLNSDGSLATIVFDGGDKESKIEIRITEQDFDKTIPETSFAFTPPEYSLAFQISQKPLPEVQRKDLLNRLAQAGNKDAQVRLLLAGILKPGQTPDAATFHLLEQRLEQAEALGDGAAFQAHADLYQVLNRNWFPANMQQLSDDQVLQRRRAILWKGADACSSEAGDMLRSHADPALSAKEKAKLEATEASCLVHWMPAEIRDAQMHLESASAAKKAKS